MKMSLTMKFLGLNLMSEYDKKFIIAAQFYHPDKKIEELTELEKEIIRYRLAGLFHPTDWQ